MNIFVFECGIGYKEYLENLQVEVTRCIIEGSCDADVEAIEAMSRLL